MRESKPLTFNNQKKLQHAQVRDQAPKTMNGSAGQPTHAPPDSTFVWNEVRSKEVEGRHLRFHMPDPN